MASESYAHLSNEELANLAYLAGTPSPAMVAESQRRFLALLDAFPQAVEHTRERCPHCDEVIFLSFDTAEGTFELETA
jgi:hypothetical protein